jgi:hypothetical protein
VNQNGNNTTGNVASKYAVTSSNVIKEDSQDLKLSH